MSAQGSGAIYNIAGFGVDAIEADQGNGTFIKLLTTRKLLGRFLLDFVRKRDVMSDYGIN
jgi:hypothetical protein